MAGARRNEFNFLYKSKKRSLKIKFKSFRDPIQSSHNWGIEKAVKKAARILIWLQSTTACSAISAHTVRIALSDQNSLSQLICMVIVFWLF
jgi:hypothetical protein